MTTEAYMGPAGLTFTERELEELLLMIGGKRTAMSDDIFQRINAWLVYMGATREIARLSSER